LNHSTPSLHPHYQASSLLWVGPSLGHASVLSASGDFPLDLFPWHRVPGSRSTPEPEPSSRRLYAGHHRGRRQASPRLRLRLTTALGFGDVPTLSTPHRRFTYVRLLGSHLTSSRPAFSGTLTTGTFTPCSFR